MYRKQKISGLIVIFFLLLINVNVVVSQFSSNINRSSLIDESKNIVGYKVSFVIGIGLYLPYQGTWPVVHEIIPLLMLKIGFLKSKIMIYGMNPAEVIDFAEGDKLIGYYPFFKENYCLFPLGIGFVCGIWIDKQ
jgi:hypothetical protein